MQHDVVIRRAAPSDMPYLYEICLKTGDSGKDAAALFNDPYIIGQYYAAPYLLFPAGICFVAEYEYRPRGYILAAPDTEDFNRWMENVWLPPLRNRYPQPLPPELFRSPNEKRIFESIHQRHFPVDAQSKDNYRADYPAHLHIDLLPDLQGKGCGRALIDNLRGELKRQGVNGIHLGVGAANEGAIAFYRKMGFSVLQEEDWGFIMGIKIGQ